VELSSDVRGSGFGADLRRLRTSAGLTQDALAERAGVGVRTIQDLEGGTHRPLARTLQRIADALTLTGEQRVRFEAAAKPVPRRRNVIPLGPRLRAVPSDPTPARPGPRGLPIPLTSFIGRKRELERLQCMLGRRGQQIGAPPSPEPRLLTLTGAPGAGKTRLAIEAAAALIDAFAEGVCFVDLAPLRDASLVVASIAQALDLRETGGRPLRDVLAAYLRDKRLLLVLDNVEHLLAAAPVVAGLLSASPGLKVLATSRERLNVRGEHEFVVPPLPLPEGPNLPSVWELPRYAAVQLFLDRARAAKSDFAVNPDEVRAIVGICRRLDGLPLALELAAARVRVLRPDEMLARLEDRLGVLTGGPRDVPERQRTLRAAIAWSYDLLNPTEQVFFRQLAVFVGGWNLPAATAVSLPVAPHNGEPHRDPAMIGGNAPNVQDALESLVSKGLVRAEAHRAIPGCQSGRFGMLETLREYAGERLAESGEVDSVRRQHAAFFLALAEEAGPQVYGADGRTWLERLDQDHDNLRAALRWAEESGEPETSLRLAAALYRFWWIRGHAVEGWRWVTRALAHDIGRRPEDDRRLRLMRALALHAAGCLADDDTRAAQPLFEEGLAIFRTLGERRRVANTLHNLAQILGKQGEADRAWKLFAESLALWRDLEDTWGLTAVLRGIAELALDQGDYARARLVAEECLTLARQDQSTMNVANALCELGQIDLHEGNFDQACARFEESLALLGELGSQQSKSVLPRIYLAKIAIEVGDYPGARSYLVASFRILRDLGYPGGSVAEALEVSAALAAARGRPEHGYRLAGGAEQLRQSVGIPVPPAEKSDLDRHLGSTRHMLGEAVVEQARAAGRTMTLEQLVSAALNEDDPYE
jgi:predicted ATPase/transcriptional regulator with XRE-family HTH domain